MKLKPITYPKNATSLLIEKNKINVSTARA
jgi:hypothetical protein